MNLLHLLSNGINVTLSNEEGDSVDLSYDKEHKAIVLSDGNDYYVEAFTKINVFYDRLKSIFNTI